MPYIKQEQRCNYELLIEDLQAALDEVDNDAFPGVLNYVITRLAKDRVTGRGEKYVLYNAIIGALECCKLELYRRMVGPYEDKAIERNGDV